MILRAVDTIVDRLLSRDPKYDDVEATYRADGGFHLVAKRDDSKVEYDLSAGTATYEYPILTFLGKPSFVDVPVMTEHLQLHDFDSFEYVSLRRVKGDNGLRVSGQFYDDSVFRFEVMGEQIVESSLHLSEEMFEEVIKRYQGIFENQSRMLDVKKYTRLARSQAIDSLVYSSQHY